MTLARASTDELTTLQNRVTFFTSHFTRHGVAAGGLIEVCSSEESLLFTEYRAVLGLLRLMSGRSWIVDVTCSTLKELRLVKLSLPIARYRGLAGSVEWY
jgi:hypothetical protein